MRRRDVLRSLGALALGPLLAPLSAMDRMRLGAALHADPAARFDSRLRILEPGQAALVSAVADTVIPRTDTPGALDAGVVEFLDRLLDAWHTETERKQFLEGLGAFDARCREATGHSFDLLDEAGRAGFLEGIDGATSGAAPGSAESSYARLKEVTVFAYLTSKPVQDVVFKTPIIPGRFDGCVPV